jgi:hypothetical protein
MGVVQNDADLVPKEQVLWREQQKIGEKDFAFVYTRSGELVVTVHSKMPGANIRAKVHNQQELTEALLMILTYDPVHGFRVDPSMIIDEPERTIHP